MKNGINVVSFFDGISCGMEALKRAGIIVNKYYAFEVDKYAIKIAMKNHPEIIQMGDVNNWAESLNAMEVPDLVMAGSPCQGFSIAGKGMNFEDPRSKLFFVFVDAKNFWKSKNPNLKFMLENVKMKKEWVKIISEEMGVEPVEINSALVSAQNRKRLYWANWSFPQPEDRGLILRDILEGSGEVDRTKSYCIDASYFKGGNKKSYFEKGRRQLVFLSDKEAKHSNGVVMKTLPRGFVASKEEVASKYPSLCAQSPAPKHLIRVGTASDIKGHDSIKRVYSDCGKAPSLTTMQGGHREPKISIVGEAVEETINEECVNNIHYRKLTTLECERLQTLTDDYTLVLEKKTSGKYKGQIRQVISNTQRYKAIGNGWTIEVISHILSFLPEKFNSA